MRIPRGGVYTLPRGCGRNVLVSGRERKQSVLGGGLVMVNFVEMTVWLSRGWFGFPLDGLDLPHATADTTRRINPT